MILQNGCLDYYAHEPLVIDGEELEVVEVEEEYPGEIVEYVFFREGDCPEKLAKLPLTEQIRHVRFVHELFPYHIYRQDTASLEYDMVKAFYDRGDDLATVMKRKHIIRLGALITKNGLLVGFVVNAFKYAGINDSVFLAQTHISSYDADGYSDDDDDDTDDNEGVYFSVILDPDLDM